MTTDTQKYCVRPNIGLILARSTCDVTVNMQGPKKAFPDVKCKDKFLIKSVVARAGTTMENAWKLFKEPKDAVEEIKLRVTYILPSQTESSKSDKSRANASAEQQMVRLVDVKPEKLIFPFELGREASCQLLLSNNTLLTVAFKVMTTDINKYFVKPNHGVILAGSTCDVKVSMRGPKEGTPDTECKDKFLIKSVIARVGTSRENVYELFKEPIDAVEDLKLTVKYVLPSHTASSSEKAQKDTPVTQDQGGKWSSLRGFIQKCQHYWLPNHENAASDMVPLHALCNTVVTSDPMVTPFIMKLVIKMMNKIKLVSDLVGIWNTFCQTVTQNFLSTSLLHEMRVKEVGK